MRTHNYSKIVANLDKDKTACSTLSQETSSLVKIAVNIVLFKLKETMRTWRKLRKRKDISPRNLIFLKKCPRCTVRAPAPARTSNADYKNKSLSTLKW